MLPVLLRNRTYRRLFQAQVIALTGTGLATVALGLLAHDIAGAAAGSVLGTALAIKMVAYVLIAPVIGAVADRLPRRALLVGADLIRAGAAFMLPFVDQVWQVYVLIFALQAASAAFTPTFQAVIPQVLPDEDDYTRALSLSRLAYDLESLCSPALAAALLSVTTYNWLFTGTVAGFAGSAALVLSVLLPRPVPSPPRAGGLHTRVAAGTRLFLAVPRLRALLALDLVVASAGAIVLVNTVVYVRDHLGRPAGDVAIALGAYGAGSMIVALVLPGMLDKVPDRAVMLHGALLTAVIFPGLTVITAAGAGAWRWPALLAVWAAFGAASSTVLTPAGRLIRRSAGPADRTELFAAQFSLTHGCWLLTYPLAGWLATAAGLQSAVLVLGAVACASGVLAMRVWPADDTGSVAHLHTGLGEGHPHVAGALPVPGGWRHEHDLVDDALHTSAR
ncbi:MFS transporter [Streptomyces barkulensis]|uniref:MFS transporter n=1 Tax=Streptomyces barkulensis TaxID=1257026 RepID=UPI000C6D7555|nr:MFS transporter [Streptomyces barkulensis]